MNVAERTVADEGEGTDIAFFEAVRLAGFDRSFAGLFDREGQLKAHDFDRIFEALHVLTKAEDGTATRLLLVCADSFEGAGAIVQGVGEQTDLRFFHIPDRSVEPHFAATRHFRPPVSGFGKVYLMHLKRSANLY